MKKLSLLIILNTFVISLFAGETVENEKTDSLSVEQAFTVMSGMFTIGENNEVPKNGKITVKDPKSGEVIGIYNTSNRTGKYLYVLPSGKTYDLTYEVEGELYKSESLIIPSNTSYYIIKKKIELGW